MKLSFLVILAMTFLQPVFSQSNIRYVTVGGAGTKDGTSWANAYDNTAFGLAIQEATNMHFRVAAGTYYPVCDADGNTAPADPRSVCFSVTGENIFVEGGFAGTETSDDQRNSLLNPTIFSGDIGTPGVNTDNAYHVWLLTNRTGEVYFYGCTVTAGNADNPNNGNDEFGGGIEDIESGQTLALDTCNIVNNKARHGGGGICIVGTGSYTPDAWILMSDDVVADDTCYDGGEFGTGGGMQIENGEGINAVQCVFVDNSAGGTADDGGGGLMVYSQDNSGSQVSLVNCTFLNNTTGSTVKPSGSAISLDVGAGVALADNLIWGNEPVVMYSTGAYVTTDKDIVKGVYLSPAWVTEAVLFADSANPAGADGQWRTPDDGLELKACSPAINAADNYYATELETMDITDQPRVYNLIRDLGAYEFQSVNPVVSPAVNLAVSPGLACTGSLLQFTTTTSNAGAPPLYEWKVNGSDAGDDTASFSSSSLNNADVVSCTVTSTDACDYGQTSTADNIIRFAPNPAISIAAAGNGACAGTPQTFTATLSNAGTDPGLSWSVDGVAGDSSVTTYSSSQLQNGNTISCTLTPGSGACGNTAIVSNAVTAVVYPLPSVSVSPADTAVVYGAQVTLYASVSPDVVSSQWIPAGSTAPDLTVVAETSSQTYTLTVNTADNCSAGAKAVVNVYQTLVMPSGFTPNGDGHNDVFRIPPGVNLNLQEFSVYDRWGARVFFTQSADTGWDGTVGGHAAQVGTYVYVVTGSNDQGPVNVKGTVMLIR